MFNRNKNIKQLLNLTFLCLAFGLNAQTKKGTRQFAIGDTALIRSFVIKGTNHASSNNDSAMYYADIGEKAALQIKNEALLAQAFFLKAKIYFFTSDYSAAQFYQYKCLVLSEKLKDRKLMSKSYNLAGAICYSVGNYKEAVKHYNNRLILSQQDKDTSSILQGYFNLSLVYNAKGEYRSAIEVNYKALELAEKTRDTLNLMTVNEGLGMSYYQIGETEKARAFLDKAYFMATKKGEIYEQGGILIDIGNIYQRNNQHYRAIYYYNKAIEITVNNGDKRRLSVAKSNKAKSLAAVKEFKQAILLYDDALKIDIEINYSKGIMDVMANKAECLMLMKRLDEAEKLILNAKELAKNLKASKEESIAYKLLEDIYNGLNDRHKAYFAYKRYVQLRDSINNKDDIRTISGIEFNYEKEKGERERKFKEMQERAEVKQQKLIRNIVLVAGVIMLFLLVFILRIYFQKRKANNEINTQNKIIEEKNEKILNSINYSREIQNAILPTEEQIKKLLSDYFILYKPKDIVSGDFYFIEPVQTERASLVVFALADCTGHGVPGALMSLMGHGILKECLKVKEVNSPGEGLDYVNKELHILFRQAQKEERVLDGMDIAFCAMDFITGELMFSGANNPLWIVSRRKDVKDSFGNLLYLHSEFSGNFLYEVKATKQPIGFNQKPENFLNHKLKLEKGDTLYLFTDGFADQFGGPKGKKYKYKQLSETILNSVNKTMQEQKQDLENSFENWKGSQEQVDDVSVLGIRF